MRRADALRDQLEQDIVTGALRPGERLDEQSLAARFGVSRIARLAGHRHRLELERQCLLGAAQLELDRSHIPQRDQLSPHIVSRAVVGKNPHGNLPGGPVKPPAFPRDRGRVMRGHRMTARAQDLVPRNLSSVCDSTAPTITATPR